MTYQLQCVSESDLPVMYALLVLCGEHMHRTLGLSHWYPFRPYDIFLQQIDPNAVYAIYSDDILAGTFALNSQPRHYYQAQLWAEPKAKALYFGMFGVLPVFQKQGIGRWATQQADRIAQEQGYAALRFDAVAYHPTLLAFYDRLGYERRGLLSFSSGRDIVCYERTFEDR
jgi:GNAT superfamily N-acetyltransferase